MKENIQQDERLQKAIARMGIASRRRAEELIDKGLVKVNGVIVKEQGIRVSPSDIIEVSGKTPVTTDVKRDNKWIYILLNKPEGVISSVTDPRNRKTVIDLIRPMVKERVYPIGRLDYDTSGLLLLTNDGELTYRLTHPSYGVEKTYRVWIKENIPKEALDQLEKGVLLEDGITSPAKIRKYQNNNKGNELTLVEITIHEGKNRQVRRMFAQVGYPLVRLQRVAFGPLELDKNMQPGDFRVLQEQELVSLKREVGL